MKPFNESSTKKITQLMPTSEQNETIPLLPSLQTKEDLEAKEQEALAYLTLLGFKPDLEAMRKHAEKNQSTSPCLIL